MAISAGTSEDVRRTNLAAILGILYRGGPASRAALSKLTGRNRSTVASLAVSPRLAAFASLGVLLFRLRLLDASPQGFHQLLGT